jgi:polyketide biosynthesis acyl carrier protein
MNIQQIVELIVRHTREVIPDLEVRHVRTEDSLRELGANSVDRSEILMMTLSSLSARISLVDLARAENIGELAGIIHGKLKCA